MKHLKVLGVGAAFAIASPLLGFPESTYLDKVLTKEICYDLILTKSNLTTGQILDEEVNIPFCLNVEKWFSSEVRDCNGFESTSNGPLQQCNFTQPANPLLEVNADGLSFNTKGYSNVKLSNQVLTQHNRNGSMELTGSINLSTNWDYRLNQIIVNKKEQYFSDLDSILIPSVNGGNGSVLSFHFTYTFQYDSETWTANSSTTSFNPIAAIAFDQNGTEYQIDITLK